ncbi:uncharacterized protein [Euwallacea fornicatus]|uniref:uncharacterized protein n=1 Tax=Euwallacea fornicatus TaxID=995702 RepID=UPI00338D5B5E
MDMEDLIKSKKRNCWRLDRAGVERRKEIFKLTRTLEIFWLIALTILILVFIPYFLSSNFIRSADYSVILIGKYVPQIEHIYVIFLTICFYFIFCLSTVGALHFLYFSWHVHLQVFMLMDFIKDLSENFAEDFVMTHCGVTLDEHYQRCIWNDLIFIIQRHIELLGYNREMMTALRFSISSMLLAISCTCLTLSGLWMAIIEHEPQAAALALDSLIVLELYSLTAQAHQDKFLAIYNLALEASWYKWDIKNRKAYLLFVQQSSQLVPYQSFNISVTKKFQFKLLKIIYLTAILSINILHSWEDLLNILETLQLFT